jgi:hypothetical protein
MAFDYRVELTDRSIHQRPTESFVFSVELDLSEGVCDPNKKMSVDPADLQMYLAAFT